MDTYQDSDFVFEKGSAPAVSFTEWLKRITAASPESPKEVRKQAAKQLHLEEKNTEYWLSPTFQVAKRVLMGHEHGFGEKTPTYLSIKRHDKERFHDWRVIQKIKTSILGPEWEAVEMYPAESRVVDTCNQYHLFCWEEEFPVYVFNERCVMTPQQSDIYNLKTGLNAKQS